MSVVFSRDTGELPFTRNRSRHCELRVGRQGAPGGSKAPADAVRLAHYGTAWSARTSRSIHGRSRQPCSSRIRRTPQRLAWAIDLRSPRSSIRSARTRGRACRFCFGSIRRRSARRGIFLWRGRSRTAPDARTTTPSAILRKPGATRGSSASWQAPFDGPPGADGHEPAMIHIANALQATIDDALPRLRALSDWQATHDRGAGKWVAKEILGHLIDSARTTITVSQGTHRRPRSFSPVTIKRMVTAHG